MSDLSLTLRVGLSETEIINTCKAIIAKHGIQEFWYYNVPVMVAIGDQTLESMSGKHIRPGDRTIQVNDFLTVDLSLGIDSHWGIYAKSFAVEGSIVKADHFDTDELRELKCIVDSLHQDMRRIVVPEMTFHDFYHEILNYVNSYNVVQLDFKSNFGHSIEKQLDDRIYIENAQMMTLAEKNIFSFEPHVRFKNGNFGVKNADIYYFEAGKPCLLADFGR